MPPTLCTQMHIPFIDSDDLEASYVYHEKSPSYSLITTHWPPTLTHQLPPSSPHVTTTTAAAVDPQHAYPNNPPYYYYYSSTESTTTDSNSHDYFYPITPNAATANARTPLVRETYSRLYQINDKRRPTPRSSLSDHVHLSSSPMSSFGSYSHYKKKRPTFRYPLSTTSVYRYALPTDHEDLLDEEAFAAALASAEGGAPLLFHPALSFRSNSFFRGKKRALYRHRTLPTHRKRLTSPCWKSCLWILLAGFLLLCLSWCSVLLYAEPLTDVEVVGIHHVLGTQKELMFNLHMKARNNNRWTIQMINTAFSVFASTHFVPTTSVSLSAPHSSTETVHPVTLRPQVANPVEYLGTIDQLDDPFLFKGKPLFQSDPLESSATSQIQIKHPGATPHDSSGNERWSLILRYPYELTVRGVVKYQLLPPWFTSLFFPFTSSVGWPPIRTVRLCKTSVVDPATGRVSEDWPVPEKSICDTPVTAAEGTFPS
ncbi:hypothetical protein BDF20DRAFT_664945 [Mycotypha africana]|uniref:uncharacterized protein n=1 Tax=Mycotypha africana TaxID=64632 RepID=UPI002301EEC4|nr:uncharacterized protein BDF20DRAFT_664945 [Mycotypha africana]KAI8973668.1 hypothetical protein BDF20DRAFT_664945 [Mycotypha africana]